MKTYSPYAVLPIPSTNSALKTVVTRIPPPPFGVVDALRIEWLHMFETSGLERWVHPSRIALVRDMMDVGAKYFSDFKRASSLGLPWCIDDLDTLSI